MIKLLLQDDLYLHLETGGHNVRIVLIRGREELACRKETVSRLHRFLQGAPGRLFKGRLQLVREGSDITVELHGRQWAPSKQRHYPRYCLF